MASFRPDALLAAWVSAACLYDIRGIRYSSDTAPFDAIGAARLIEAPTLFVHSENALAPALARKFAGELRRPAEVAWLTSSGQIDFYDDPILIGQAADLIAVFLNRVLYPRA